jgi:RimJ/RimL family protein N-acetyltransferase
MKVILRPFQWSDLKEMTRLANNPKVATNLTDAFPSPYTLEAAQQFFKRVSSVKITEVLAIEVDGKLVGNIGIHPQDDVNRRNAELGYFIGEEYWGKGIATEAIKLMVQYGFDHFDIHRIFARPFGKNIASQRVLEKAGFTLEARIEGILIKNGKIEDELIYGVRRG